MRPSQYAGAKRSLSDDVTVVTTIDELIAAKPSVAVECAGHQFVQDSAATILAAGIDLLLASSGALARADVLDSLVEAAGKSGSHIFIPSGAVAGLDGLGALKASGLTFVRYTSIKPPLAWRGTTAERLLDLSAVSRPTVLYEGSARDAALAFPKNANLAATVALAGIGFERTVVRLQVDPAATSNSSVLEARSEVGTLVATMSAVPSDNPKTSATAAYSLIHALRSRSAAVIL